MPGMRTSPNASVRSTCQIACIGSPATIAAINMIGAGGKLGVVLTHAAVAVWILLGALTVMVAASVTLALTVSATLAVSAALAVLAALAITVAVTITVAVAIAIAIAIAVAVAVAVAIAAAAVTVTATAPAPAMHNNISLHMPSLTRLLPIFPPNPDHPILILICNIIHR